MNLIKTLSNKLEKLKVTKIRIIEDVQGIDPYEVLETNEIFEFQFNPRDYSLSYNNDLLRVDATSYRRRFNFISSEQTLNLKLILDGTDAVTNTFSLSRSKKITVKEKVKEFLELSKMEDSCDGVKVEWGSLLFHGQINNINVAYTLFDRSGDPLRAELSVSILGSAILSDKGQAFSSKLIDNIGRIAAPLAQGLGLAMLAANVIKNNTTATASLIVAAKNGLNSIRNFDPKKDILSPIEDEVNEIADKLKEISAKVDDMSAVSDGEHSRNK